MPLHAPLRTCIALLPIALAAASCRSDTAQGASNASSVHVSADGGKTTITIHGVTLEVDGTVPFRSVSTTSGGVHESTSTLLGHPFGVTDGTFHIGPANYGAVAAGDRVRVAQDGVFVGDERRGDLPAAK